MDLRQAARISWQSIRGHKLRSSLTTLGVVIGVAAVITFVTLGGGLEQSIIGDVGGGGAASVNVWATEDENGPPGAGAQPVFTERDVESLRSVEGVESVVPRSVVPLSAVEASGETVAQSQATAVTPAYFDDEDIAEGRAFEDGQREVVVNPAAASLFEENVTVGDRVNLSLGDGRTVNATVVGVLASSQGLGAFDGLDASPRVYVPPDPFYSATVTSPTTGEHLRVYPTLVVEAERPEEAEAVGDRVVEALEEDSDAAQLAPDDYEFAAQTNEQLLDQLRDILDTLTDFIVGVAVISLVVGSIGIANIMLVSVTERTREIGIMKAVGAQNRDILQLFLLEAVVLGVVGAVLGTVLGVVAGYVATVFVDIPFVFPWTWTAIAVVVGILVGVLAGLYPAWNASRTDPIDALRYE
ncbi:ABC transporter permease [Halomarina ordinaria]|uniref:ABC transporter permease n=1 Tax=Halomarina ordinaria TaxID=3033939 RepID=A0ABD5U843_9EURY|nr:ABC transporter permease [Halomarina sp. PSRA2]